MDDEPKSMPAWLHNHDEEHADIEEFDTDDSVEDDVRTTDESGPAEYSYQPTTIGSLETNHAAIASAVPGSGAAASSVSAGARPEFYAIICTIFGKYC